MRYAENAAAADVVARAVKFVELRPALQHSKKSTQQMKKN
jgi:hypothetical protein